MKKFVKMSFIIVVVVGLIFAASAQAMMGNGGGYGTMGTYMQMPTAQEMFQYGSTTTPVIGTDISTTMPIGVGTVAMGGNMITIHATIGQFPNAMDMYLAIYAPALDPFNIYLMHPDGTLKPVSMGIEPWMAAVTAIDQTPFANMSTSAFPKGTYTVGFMATPTGANMATYYMWTTDFVVQ